VFVRLADDRFELRRVEIEATEGELLGVRGRLVAGDLVVSDGSFLLKTEILKDSMGSGCCEVD
jgi:cobalt-zinc-cadmium efflux system membrane fusion protein